MSNMNSFSVNWSFLENIHHLTFLLCFGVIKCVFIVFLMKKEMRLRLRDFSQNYIAVNCESLLQFSHLLLFFLFLLHIIQPYNIYHQRVDYEPQCLSVLINMAKS